jgi:ABC-type multidrug transport system fused ATPase/permease subunit
MSPDLGPAGSLGTGRVLIRALRSLRPFRGRIAGRVGLACLSALSIVLVPWPLKILIDAVILGQPLLDSPTPYPFFIEPLIQPLVGASPETIAVSVGLAFAALILLFGSFGDDGSHRRHHTESRTVGGADVASRTENQANQASSSSGGVLGLLEFRFTLRLAQAVNHELRTRLFERIQSLPMVRLDERRIGDAVYRLMYDTPAISTLCVYLPVVPIRQPLEIGLAIWLLSLSYGGAPGVVWLGLLSLPLALIVAPLSSRAIRRRNEASRQAGSATTTTMEEGIANVLAVQSLGGEERERQHFDRGNAESFLQHRRYIGVHMLAVLGMIALGLPAMAGVFIYITDLIIEGALTVGDLGVLLVLYFRIAVAAATLAWLWITLQDNLVGMRRVFELMDEPGDEDAPGARELPPVTRGVTVEGASYHYPDGTRALEDVDLSLKLGELVALVGPAGAGKTTLAYLLPRFLTASSGRVCVDGTDVRQVRYASLRRQVSFVFQETLLFDASVEQNIRFARPDATREQVRRAAKLSGAHEFIERLPEGYATRLGRAGGNLSVGQKQRLSIARALVRETPLLILDEPTAALDLESERSLLAALQQARQRHGVLVIAHRLSTIRAADRIYFVEAGRVVEQGSHAELMARPGGAYRRFVTLQTRGAA